MSIYIDLFFSFNTIMDMIIITSVSILLKRNTSYLRIILSSLLGGLSSVLLFTSINKLILEIITITIMTIVSFKYKNIRYFITNIIYTYMLSILLGGLIYLFNSKVTINTYLNYLVIIIISLEVMTLYIKESKKIKNTYNNYYKVDIYFKDKEKLSLVGFVDTGNNLYDPYKKRPIILVDKKYQVEKDFILVPYHTVTGEGLLKCIKPEKIYIENIGYKTNLLVSFTSNPNLINGVDVLLHKELMKGW